MWQSLPDNKCDLRLEVGHHRLVLHHDSQVACTLVVQTKVLAEALRAKDLEALFHKVANGPGIRTQGSTGKTLIGAVEEDKEVPGLANLCDLGPLLLGGVHPGGVVGAGVQDDDSSRRCLTKILHHAGEVEAPGLRVPVAVLSQVGVAGPSKDEAVIAPGGVGVVHCVLAKDPVQEVGADSQRSCSTQSLEEQANYKLTFVGF